MTCRCQVVSLLEAAQHLLEQRAAASDLSSQPQAYDVLYDFYCLRSNFKAAAAAQYSLACRLQQEGSQTLHRLQRRAAALCKLHLLMSLSRLQVTCLVARAAACAALDACYWTAGRP